MLIHRHKQLENITEIKNIFTTAYLSFDKFLIRIILSSNSHAFVKATVSTEFVKATSFQLATILCSCIYLRTPCSDSF